MFVKFLALFVSNCLRIVYRELLYINSHTQLATVNYLQRLTSPPTRFCQSLRRLFWIFSPLRPKNIDNWRLNIIRYVFLKVQNTFFRLFVNILWLR